LALSSDLVSFTEELEKAESRFGSVGLCTDTTRAANGSASERVNNEPRRIWAGSSGVFGDFGVLGSMESAREREEDTELDGALPIATEGAVYGRRGAGSVRGTR
jgi:hypothetical protein